MAPIQNIKHPHYVSGYQNYLKWRSIWEGGEQFVERYLKKFSTRETDSDFATRKSITYIPAHAKAAIIDVRNAIFQRMPDVIREGGTPSYRNAVAGLDTGVDRNGSSLDAWIGHNVLPELMAMGKVGVYVDRPTAPKALTAATTMDSPYLYYFQIEDIRSWSFDAHGELETLLLREHYDLHDEETGLVCGTGSRYRLAQRTDTGVVVTFWEVTNGDTPNQLPSYGVIETHELKLSRIPFVLLDIGQSLLADIADHQIALLNMGSSDINYVVKSNFPFYTEQVAPGYDLLMAPPGGQDDSTGGDAARARKIEVGVVKGRAYPKGTERPGFIHPSSEPLKASMAKQQQLKNEIRELINLALSNVSPGRASAESKLLDNQGLEAGLSYIGLELQRAEREIAKFWSAYEGAAEVAHIKYPDNYQLKTDKDRRSEAKELNDLKDSVPSPTYRKLLCKEIVRVTVGHKTHEEVLSDINGEIDAAEVVETDSDTIRNDHEAGLVSTETASRIRGYPQGEVEQAKKDHAERLRRINMAQSDTTSAAARGLPDMDGDPTSGSKERAAALDNTQHESTADRSRGEGKNTDA